MSVPAKQQPQQPQSSRMSLQSVVKGKQQKPFRVLLYGTEGVGKSTFGAESPNPIFLGAEDGTDHLDVERLPVPHTWTEVLEAIRVLEAGGHNYKTLVVDTLDHAEPLLFRHICQRDGKKDIEDYGYAKGYILALDEWRIFLGALERLRAKGMNLIFLAHSWVKPFKNPAGNDFDRYELKLHPKAGGLIKEWVDCVLFAEFETFANKDDKTKRIKGVSTGARLVHTIRTAAYDAKNRYGLPETMPLSFDEFWRGVQAHRPMDPAVVLAQLQEKAPKLDEATKKSFDEYLAKAGSDAVKLAKLNDWVNGKLQIAGKAE